MLCEIPNTDESHLIDQYLIGLRPDLQNACSFNRRTGGRWDSLEEISRNAILEDGDKPFLNANANTAYGHTPRSLSSAQVGRTNKRTHPSTESDTAGGGNQTQDRSTKRRRGNSGGVAQIGSTRPPAGFNLNQGPDSGPYQPNTPGVQAAFRVQGATKDTDKWNAALANWLRHVRKYGLCNYCGQEKHITWGCSVPKGSWIIAPLFDKPLKGPARMGTQGM